MVYPPNKAVAASIGLRSHCVIEFAIEKHNGPYLRFSLPDIDLVDKIYSFEDLLPFLKKAASLGIHPFAALTPQSEENIAKVEKISQELSLFLSHKSTNTRQKTAEIALLTLFVCLKYGISDQTNLEKQKTSSTAIQITSDIPVGAGLGSSAAYSVALASCLLLKEQLFVCLKNGKICSLCQQGEFCIRQKKVINSWAYLSEGVIHGRASGLDNAVSCFGGAVRFQKGITPVPIQE